MPLSQSAQSQLSADAIANINKWLDEPKYKEYKSELEDMIAKERWQELEDAFFKVIEFGTGGRRGITGIGSNRINRVTIGESAQALCSYVQNFDPDAAEKGVVIACDTRLTSPELSRYTAQVCAANGFKTYIFDEFRSTPELSFAVRHLGAAIGIVISASHNPPQDNGFKAYWTDGGQLVAPHDIGVLAEAAKINVINTIDYDDAVKSEKVRIISKEVDDAYVAAATHQAEGDAREINIVYSPLHGAGQTNVLPVLRAAGFASISVVEAQMVPDGNFPTVGNGKANPEEPSANDMAVRQMLSEGADIAITNDPDADRIGVIVRQNKEPIYLNGNQSAVLATDYVLQQRAAKKMLDGRQYIAKTIVTTDLLDAIAHKYNVNIYGNFLVGFKYIGELIKNKEDTKEEFLIGGEESYGLLKGDYARDKDGATGALALAEYAAYLKQKGMTLNDRLFEIYSEHGLYLERLDNVQSPGADGFERMQKIMRNLRSEPPKMIGGHQVTSIIDYRTLKKINRESGDVADVECVSGDVIVLEFGDHRRRITIRPSGTEPKMKFYTQWYEDASEDIVMQYDVLTNKLESISKELATLLFS